MIKENVIDAVEDSLDHIGIYPKSVHGEGGYEERTEYMNGWNEAVIKLSEQITNTLDSIRDDENDEDVQLLLNSGYIEYSGVKEGKYYINMNDVWAWALSDGEYINNENEIKEIAKLFKDYGWCGILYWVSKKNNGMRSEFYDNNRMIEFVENEERIKKEVPDYNERAYHKTSYTIKGTR